MKIEDFLNKDGRTISTKVRDCWIKKNFPDDYRLMIEYSNSIGIGERKIGEKIYHYLNKIHSPVLCKNCNINITKFKGINAGYLDYCSSKCSNNSLDVKNLKEKTNIKKYGVDNPSKSKEIIDRIKDTFDLKYGGNPFSLENFKERIKITNLQKYGKENALSMGSTVREQMSKNKENDFIEKYKNYNITYYSPEKNGISRLICEKCNEEYEISKWNLHQRSNSKVNPCTICNPISSDLETSCEAFIENFLIDSGIIYMKKTRKILDSRKEIDFYLPDYNIGIEVNGIYWHSSIFKENNYHVDKTNECLDKGIKLIQIFEDLIVNKPDIVISRLSSILNKCQNKIYARKCEIRLVNYKEYSNFLENNHLQGSVYSKIPLGLYHDSNLVALMTFGPLRKSLGSNSIQGVWELLRFASLKNINVVGGASKLLNFFINEYKPNSIISYCDRSWSPDGSFYSNLGFTFDKNTNPNYWYFKQNSYLRKHRFNFRKDLLVKQGFDSALTEFEIMENRKYYRVYDCGNSKWILKL